MKKWDIQIGQEDKTIFCRGEDSSIQVDAGMCAIDFLSIDWAEFSKRLKEVKAIRASEDKIVHCRLREPETAPYYCFARWVNETVEQVRKQNPVYGEVLWEWLQFEVERPYLTAYRGSEESFGVDRILNEMHQGIFNTEKITKYSKDIHPSAEKVMVVSKVLLFINAYPAFPNDARFSVSDEWVQRYQSGNKPLDHMSLRWEKRSSTAEECNALDVLMSEYLNTANAIDRSLIEVTEECIDRLLNWLELMPIYQGCLTKLIAYTIDADEVSTVKEVQTRLDKLAEKAEYQTLEKTRDATCNEKGLPHNRNVTPYRFSPLLVVLDEFAWLCSHRKRKLKKCGHCGQYFIVETPKVRFCNRRIEDSEETCREFENRISKLSPRIQEIERMYKNARDSYCRRLRNSPNRPSKVQNKAREEFEKWKKVSIQHRDSAKRGEISIEKLRELLDFRKAKL